MFLNFIHRTSYIKPSIDLYLNTQQELYRLQSDELFLCKDFNEQKSIVHNIFGDWQNEFIIWLMQDPPSFSLQELELLKFLKKYQINLSCLQENSYAWTIPACVFGNTALLRWFIEEENYTLDAFNEEHLLSYAFKKNLIELSNYILEIMPKLSINADTALLVAVYSNNLGLLQWLILEKHYDINESNLHGITPLIMAAKVNNNRILRWLLDNHSVLNLNIYAANNEGHTFEYFLAKNNNYTIIDLCLNTGLISLNPKDDLSLTVLDIALENKHEQTINVCIDFVLYCNQKAKKHHKISFKMFQSYLSLLDYLQEHKKQYAYIENGQTALHLACEHSDILWLKKFITSHRCDINTPNKQGETPLCFMIKNQFFTKSIWFIKQFNPNISKIDSRGASLLYLSCEKQNLELIKFCFSKKISLTKILASTSMCAFDLILKQRNTELIFICWSQLTTIEQQKVLDKLKKLPENKKLLLDAIKPVEPNIDSYELLLQAINLNKIDEAKSLLKTIQTQEVAHSNDNYALFLACSNNLWEIVKLLLQITKVSELAHLRNNEPLKFALNNQEDEIVETLLSITSVQNTAHLNNNALLINMIQNGYIDMITILLTVDSIRNALFDNPEDAFRCAVEYDHEDIENLLMTYHPVLNFVRDQEDLSDKYNAFCEKCRAHHITNDMIKLSSTQIFTPSIMCDAQFTNYFVQPQHMIHKPFIMDYSYPAIYFDHNSPICLIVNQLKTAVNHEQLIEIERLLGLLVGVEYIHPEISDLLYLIINYNKLSVLQVILRFEVIQSHISANAISLCALASGNGNLEILQDLLRLDSVMQKISYCYNKSLKSAIKNNHQHVAQYLLSLDNVQKYAHIQNNYALRISMKNGLIEIATSLLQLSNVIKLANIWGNTIFKKAILFNHLDISNRLLNCTSVLYDLVRFSKHYHHIIKEFVQNEMRSFNPENYLSKNNVFYFIIMRFCIQQGDRESMGYLRLLLSIQKLKDIAHISFWSKTQNNELLSIAKMFDCKEAADMLMEIPLVRSATNLSLSTSSSYFFRRDINPENHSNDKKISTAI